ncbi:hypothetical protein SALBM311S_11896 [Streptomyces alboniger]
MERGGRWLALHGTNSVIERRPRGPRLFTTPRLLGDLAGVLGSQFLAHAPIDPYEAGDPAGHPLAGHPLFTVADWLASAEPW